MRIVLMLLSAAILVAGCTSDDDGGLGTDAVDDGGAAVSNSTLDPKIRTGQAQIAWTLGVTAAGEGISILGTGSPILRAEGDSGAVAQMTWTPTAPTNDLLRFSIRDGDTNAVLALAEGQSPIRLVVPDAPAAMILALRATDGGVLVDQEVNVDWALYVDQPVDPDHAFE